jgi:hypothetical protein
VAVCNAGWREKLPITIQQKWLHSQPIASTVVALVPSQKEGYRMTYEYKIVQVQTLLQETLTKEGKDSDGKGGWELIAIQPAIPAEKGGLNPPDSHRTAEVFALVFKRA